MRRLAAAIGTLLFLTACSEPPQKEIDRAQGAIDAARAAGADQYATESFAAATTAMQQTHEAVQQRDYRLALSRAVDANERALEAARQAADGKARAQSNAQAALARTAAAAGQLAEQLKAADAARVPARDLAGPRKLQTEAQRTLQEARAAIEKGAFAAAVARLDALSTQIAAGIDAVSQAVEGRAGRGQRRRR